MQDDGDRVAQGLKVIVAHVTPADRHHALGDVVEAADELNEGGLGRAGSADNTERGARINAQVDVRQGVLLGLVGVLEGHSLKDDGAVGHLGCPTGGRGQGGLMGENLGDAVRGLGSHGRHDEDEGEHKHVRQNLDAVGDERGQAALGEPLS